MNPTSRIDATLFAVGCACLLVATTASLLLTLEHVGHLSLPGCGAGGACARAVASRWGTVPGTGWPVALVGLAYFAGASTAWLLSRSGLSRPLLYVTRLGAVVSLGYTAVIILQNTICHYCLAAHAANFGFWFVSERSRPLPRAAWRPIVASAAVGVTVAAVTGAVWLRAQERVAGQRERELEAATARIIEADRRRAESAGNDIYDREHPWRGGFTGRYRLGPERASARIVMITDYECPDCYLVEQEAMALVTANESVSLSIKYFPMNVECNPYFPRALHANACWAARAAEAAGIMGGAEGFFRMHRWLFQRKGSFDDAQLRAALHELGFDATRFIALLTAEETLAAVQADVEDAMWLGLHYTPMVFVNGVELKGVIARGALTRAVSDVLAQNLPAATADLDQPPPALDKSVDDWRSQPVLLSPQAGERALGPKEPAIRVVVWGDFQEPSTAVVDSVMRATAAAREDVRYTFRYYPVNRECNPACPVDKHPLACLAARTAEAVRQMGGEDAYWTMHAWLMENSNGLTLAGIDARASALGLDVAQLRHTMNGDIVAGVIAGDCAAARAAGVRSIPMVFVNERFVPRWRLRHVIVLDRILQAAATQRISH